MINIREVASDQQIQGQVRAAPEKEWTQLTIVLATPPSRESGSRQAFRRSDKGELRQGPCASCRESGSTTYHKFIAWYAGAPGPSNPD